MEDKAFIESQAVQHARTTDDFLVKKYNKKRVQSFFGKLGNSLGMVVTVLPFAGLLLAIGGILISKGTTTDASNTIHANEAMMTAGLVLSDIGNAVYANLGLFFMLAIVMGFTGAKGMAVYSTIIGYIAFVGFILPFIRYEPAMVDNVLSNDPANAKYFHIWFWQNIGGSGHGLDVVTQLDNVLGMKQVAFTPDTKAKVLGTEFGRLSYQGIRTLNTGVLGGIALGFIYSWEFNKTKDLKLPSILSFFEGEKFTSVIMLLTAPIVASLFIIVWPAVNYALAYIGIGLNYIPFGLNSFLYGIVFQILLPFQAHMAFIAPLWWTSAGGNLGDAATQQHIVEAMMYRLSGGGSAGIAQEASFYADHIKDWVASIKVDGTSLSDFLAQYLNGKSFNGNDLFNNLVNVTGGGNHPLNLEAIKQPLIDYGKVNWNGTVGDQLISVELLTKNPGFDMRDAWSANIKSTKYITTGFANDLFMLPAAGFGMWLTLPKDRRKEKFGLYLGAILSSVFFGVSEPIIFMFAFMCPLIYFLFYCPLFGLLAWISVFLQSKVGSTFSQGLMDYVINGILPTATKTAEGGAQTQLWWPIVVGAIAFVPSMYAFKWMFVKVEFAVPGSYAAEEGIGTSESRFTSIKPTYDETLEFFGGLENIEKAEVINKKKLKLTLKRADWVMAQNDYSKRNIESIFSVDNVYTVTFTERAGVNIDYVKMIARMVDIKNREKEYKQFFKVERAKLEERLTGCDSIAQAKADTKKNIADYSKLFKANIAKANKIEDKAKRKETISKLKADKANFIQIQHDGLKAKIKFIKKSKQGIDKAAERKAFKQEMKLFKLTTKKIEKINEVRADWMFQEHNIIESSDIDKFKLQHQLKMWEMKNLQEKQLAKISYKTNAKLLDAGFKVDDEPVNAAASTHDQKAQLKKNYEVQMKELNNIDKSEINQAQQDYKTQLKAMEDAKAKAFKQAENK